jgi:hypothetical protein
VKLSPDERRRDQEGKREGESKKKIGIEREADSHLKYFQEIS